MKITLFKTICLALALSLSNGLHAQTEKATPDPDIHVTVLTALEEGQASISLVWNTTVVNPLIERQLQSILLTQLNSDSKSATARQSQDFRTINAVDYMVSSTPNHLILTMQSDQETFHDAIDHLAGKLSNRLVDPNWYKRILTNYKQVNSSKVRRPENVEIELMEYILYNDSKNTLTDIELIREALRLPNQIIFNAQDFDFTSEDEGADEIIFDALFFRESQLASLPAPTQRTLPTGTIYVSDPEATETLIFLANSQDFETDTDQAMADTLYKYMGYGPGSEMFRIVRQEKRASYDPRSHFTQLENKSVISGLSATVPSESWFEIYKVIAQIYENTRNGDNTLQGLENSKNSMLNGLITNLRRDPNWLVERYLELYPNEPPQGAIKLGILGASFDVKTQDLNENSKRVLKPLDQMLTIIYGGATPPPEELRQNGFCQLEINQPLADCLNQLSK